MSKAQGIAQSANQGQFKNRIINGAMTIDQRNNGASVTPSGLSYQLDRWQTNFSQASKFTIQQNAGSVTPPIGFSNYYGATVASTATVGVSDYFYIGQQIEGNNVADLAWGTASAAPVTLSFWVRSSVTGSFGGAIKNSQNNYTYPFLYTIVAANTWEYKTITITGATGDTWSTNNTSSIYVVFALAMGSNRASAANTWNTSGGSVYSATGATNIVTTSGATFYITGVQLEKGSTATSFDYRPYGTELHLAQRYYQVFYGNSPGLGFMGRISAPNTGNGYGINVSLQATMRTDPTVTRLGTWSVINSGQPSFYGDTKTVNIFSQSNNSGDTFFYANDATKGFTVSAEL